MSRFKKAEVSITLSLLFSLLIKFIMAQSQRWCFTLNNYTHEEVYGLRLLAENVQYLVFGRERGENETPHLQGFVIFSQRLRLRSVKRHLGNRAHVEIARGTSQQAADYCKKDSDFEEFGSLPTRPGKTNAAEEFKAWVCAQPTKPTVAQACEEHFGFVSGRGVSRTQEFIDILYPDVIEVEGEYRHQQATLAERLASPPDDRKIIFVVDPVGGAGKSWFIKKYFADHRDSTQVLSVGKRDDVAHTINPSRSVFLFDLPRSSSEFLQYTVLEQLKDRFVFSPKYNSRTKVLKNKCHVVVFMNEEPDMNKLSADRYEIIHWN